MDISIGVRSSLGTGRIIDARKARMNYLLKRPPPLCRKKNPQITWQCSKTSRTASQTT